MQRLSHPNVAQFYGFDIQNSILLQELALCNFADALYRQKQEGIATIFLTPEQKFKCIFDILRAIKFIHFNEIILRHLKLSNILLFRNPHPHTAQDEYIAKLGDFGLSKVMSLSTARSRDSIRISFKEQSATDICYMAPELFDSLDYAMSCDIYSLGRGACNYYCICSRKIEML
jgi:serine/threonine protein kinase